MILRLYKFRFNIWMGVTLSLNITSELGHLIKIFCLCNGTLGEGGIWMGKEQIPPLILTQNSPKLIF